MASARFIAELAIVAQADAAIHARVIDHEDLPLVLCDQAVEVAGRDNRAVGEEVAAVEFQAAEAMLFYRQDEIGDGIGLCAFASTTIVESNEKGENLLLFTILVDTTKFSTDGLLGRLLGQSGFRLIDNHRRLKFLPRFGSPGPCCRQDPRSQPSVRYSQNTLLITITVCLLFIERDISNQPGVAVDPRTEHQAPALFLLNCGWRT